MASAIKLHVNYRDNGRLILIRIAIRTGFPRINQEKYSYDSHVQYGVHPFLLRIQLSKNKCLTRSSTKRSPEVCNIRVVNTLKKAFLSLSSRCPCRLRRLAKQGQWLKEKSRANSREKLAKSSFQHKYATSHMNFIQHITGEKRTTFAVCVSCAVYRVSCVVSRHVMFSVSESVCVCVCVSECTSCKSLIGAAHLLNNNAGVLR